jgi:hypothetical protein
VFERHTTLDDGIGQPPDIVIDGHDQFTSCHAK